MTTYTDETAEADKAKKRLSDLERVKKFNRDKAVKTLFETKEGRTFLWHLMEITGAVGVNSFGPDPLQTAFICGQQSVGQRLMSQFVEVNPEGFAALMMEQLNDGYVRSQHNTRTDPRSNGGTSRDDGADQPDLFSLDNAPASRDEDFYN